MSDSTHPTGEPLGATDTTQPAILDPAHDASEVKPVPQPGDTIANPAEPLAPTTVPGKADIAAFSQANVQHQGYPKWLYHPVHGALEILDPNAESGLLNRRDWFDLPELADAARTATEAWMAQAHNTRAKLAEHDDAGHPIVRNSVQADEAIRTGAAEPL